MKNTAALRTSYFFYICLLALLALGTSQSHTNTLTDSVFLCGSGARVATKLFLLFHFIFIPLLLSSLFSLLFSNATSFSSQLSLN